MRRDFPPGWLRFSEIPKNAFPELPNVSEILNTSEITPISEIVCIPGPDSGTLWRSKEDLDLI